MNHKTVKIKHKNLEADIDELIASLVLALWKNNISTCFSCQEDETYDTVACTYVQAGYIQFDEEKQLLKLLNLAAKKFRKILLKSDSWIP